MSAVDLLNKREAEPLRARVFPVISPLISLQFARKHKDVRYGLTMLLEQDSLLRVHRIAVERSRKK
jgi:hypothetical protein